MNWHGKPLGAKADKVINEIQKNMKSQSMSLRPQAITASVPDVDITNIKLADPLKYEMGQQVMLMNVSFRNLN
jgi:transketolase